ncbi:MAG: hypothetical protein ABI175_26960, partial [Polyangiales bacterium]
MTDPLQTPPPRELVATNAEAIALVRARADRKVDRHQRLIELVTESLGRPRSLYVVCLLVAGWIALNVVMGARGQAPLDP